MNLEVLKMAGWKTYGVVAVGVLVHGAEAMGILQPGTADKLDGLLTIVGLGTLRAGVAKAAK